MIIKPALSSYLYFFYVSALLPVAYVTPLIYAELYGIANVVIGSPLFWFFIGLNITALGIPLIDYFTRYYDIQSDKIIIHSLISEVEIPKDENFEVKEVKTLPDAIFGTKTYLINGKYWLTGVKNPEFVFESIIRGG